MMTLEQLGIIIAILTSVGGWVYFLIHTSSKFGKLELKVETLWDLIVNHMMSETIHKGLATLNSPFVVSDAAKVIFVDLEKELQALYAANSVLSDGQLMLKIQREYGKRILESICIPNNLTHGTCLMIATAVAKNSDTIEVNT